jgi:hypothetical protein
MENVSTIDQNKLLEAIQGKGLNNQNVIENRLKNDICSHSYLMSVCKKAGVFYNKVWKDEVLNKSLPKSSKPNLTPKVYKSLSHGYQGD